MNGIQFFRVRCYRCLGPETKRPRISPSKVGSSFVMFGNAKSNRYSEGVSLDFEEEFVRLHKACCRSLEAFYKKSQQALNALALAELFPNDIEKRNALEFHLKAETGAKQKYERRRRDLSDFLKARVETPVEEKAPRKRRQPKRALPTRSRTPVHS